MACKPDLNGHHASAAHVRRGSVHVGDGRSGTDVDGNSRRGVAPIRLDVGASDDDGRVVGPEYPGTIQTPTRVRAGLDGDIPIGWP